MTLWELAADIFDAAESMEIPHMAVGAIAVGAHGIPRTPPPFKVELFEMFDDPFVISEFSRRVKAFVPMLSRELWIQTAEDRIVQKLRWGRSKDLDDALDVLAVQDPANLDMPYIEKWCTAHGTMERLATALAQVPEI